MTSRRMMQAAAAMAMLGVVTLPARAQPAPPLINPVGAAADPAVDGVLNALQNSGQHLHAFTADLALTETDTVMGTGTVRNGRVWYQLQPDGTARLHVVFNDKSMNDKPAQPEKKEYLLDGPWLVDRDYPAKVEARRQIAHAGEKVNLFQLGKGPFPLPIGQDPAEVKSLFAVTRVEPAGDDPPGTDHLKLTPKPGTDFARKIYALDVWVDRKQGMPVRIETVDAPQTTDRQTDLKNLRVNPTPGVGDGDFALPPLGPGWNQHDEPLE